MDVLVEVGVDVLVLLGVCVAVHVWLGVCEEVLDCEDVWVEVLVWLAVWLAVCVDVLVEVCVAVFDAVLDAVCVTEDVGVGLRMRDAMLRPRKVMEERVASASPASHRLDSSTPLE